MGLFSRGPKLSSSDKVRARALKAGFDPEGAVAVAHCFRDNQDQYLFVFPDRVDIHRTAKIGSFLGAGRGVESYPLQSITSASVKQDGIWSVLTFTASEVAVEFRGPMDLVPAAREAIMQAKASL